jgi:hypothetical protein
VDQSSVMATAVRIWLWAVDEWLCAMQQPGKALYTHRETYKRDQSLKLDRVRTVLIEKTDTVADCFARSVAGRPVSERSVEDRARRYCRVTLRNFRYRDLMRVLKREDRYKHITAGEWDEQPAREESPKSDVCAYGILESFGLSESELELAQSRIFYGGRHPGIGEKLPAVSVSDRWEWENKLKPKIRSLIEVRYSHLVPDGCFPTLD